MSGANADCHVSTKWEDTGGKVDSECDANVLLSSPNTNGDSLQELFEKEFALRSSAVMNGVDRPKSLLICDEKADDDDDDVVDDNNEKMRSDTANKKVEPFDIFDVVTPVNGCNRSNSFKLTRGVAVAEVDDFDVLYNEVSDGELVSNENVTLTGLLSPELELSIASSLSDDKSEGKRDVVESPTSTLVEADSVSAHFLTSFSDETESSLDSVRVAYGTNNHSIKSVDFTQQSFDDPASANSATNNDFVPISEVDIVDDEQEDGGGSARKIVAGGDPSSTVSMNSMIDVQKVVEDMEDSSRRVTDDHDPIENAQESGNQRKKHDVEEVVVGVTPADVINDIAQQCHYDTDDVADAFSIEEDDCDRDAVYCNGDATGDVRDVLVLGEEGCESTNDRTDFQTTFEKGFERWSIETSNVAMIAATCEKSSVLTNGRFHEVDECSRDLTMSCDVVPESNMEEKKNVKKKKSTSEESVTTSKTKKTKKTKKYEEKENISVRSGFGKFDQLTKKTVMHVRSSDATKAPQQFSQNDASQDSGNRCKACNKNVFAMEQIKAERHVWHKNCFRCKTCNKQLTVDGYSSHEGELFCKPHFRDLFKPKTVIEDEQPTKLKKPELIIRENEPVELPPDVVRASDKPDLGLEELSSLNVKSRFQVFEKAQVEETTDKSPVSVKRSPSILSKLAKFQAKGMDVGVSSDIFNGIDYEESSSSEDEEHAPDDNITRSTVVKEKPIAFNNMNDVKKNWENGQATRKEERLEQRREELQNIRSRLFQGKQNRMKEAYENAVAESEKNNVKRDVEIRSEKARSIKEKFEKGEILPSDDSDTEADKKACTQKDDMDVFDAGISKQSRSLFQQMDAAMKTQSRSNVVSSPTPSTMQNGHRSFKDVMNRQLSTDVVRASDPVEEVTVQTSDISSKFKFFETYKAPEVKRKVFRITPPREGQQLKSESPERDIQKNPDVVRCDEQIDDGSEVLKKSNTTSKMLSIFRQMEVAQDNVPDGPRPMKKFTPPPQSHNNSESESDEESSEASDPADDIIRASDKTEDEYLIMAQKATKAKALKEKFEKWEPERQLSSNSINLLESEQANLDSAKSIRARFESMKAEQPTDRPRPKVNRFV